MKILVVDDNRVNLSLHKGVLEKKGHTVLTAENGKQGLERLLVEEDIDLIISDILMPVMDGYQFCQHVKLIDRFSHIPFILCTGTYTEEKDEALAYSLGASYFIRKGSSAAMLGEIVEKVISDTRQGKISPKTPEEPDGKEVYKLYSERLVNKLEEKMQQLDSEMMAMEQEVAERKKVEDALRAGKEFAESLFESAPVIMLILDPDGRIVRFNPFMENISGYSLEQVRGKDWKTVFEPEPVSLHTDYPKDFDAAVDANPISRCTSIRTRDGRRREIEWNEKDLLDKNGHVIGLLAAGQDVTDRLKMQQSLLKAYKFEAIGRLAGSLAHDFNNLLAIIIGSISLAEDDAAPHIGESEYLKTARTTALRAKELTSRLAAMAKNEMQIRQAVEISEIVKGAANTALQHADTRCEIEVEADLWPAKADPDQIRQVIYDIVLNAVEAMAGGGSVIIRCVNRTIGDGGLPLCPGRFVKISVTDNGPGIAAHLLPEIFDPYFSTKETAVRKGMGLGLAVAYSIVEKHAGHIDVASKAGKGTTVTVYLPASETAAIPESDASCKAAPDQQQSAGRILIMEDEELLRNLSVQMLKREGHAVASAAGGEETVTLYRKAFASGAPFDVVILDLTNPVGMGAIEAMQNLKEIDPHVKAILATGFSSEPVVNHYQEHGFCGVLLKPYTREELVNVINTVLASGAA